MVSPCSNWHYYSWSLGFPDGLAGKESTCNTGEAGGERLIPRSKDPLEEGMAIHSNILLENPMDRGVWRATVHEVAESQTRLKGLSTLWQADPFSRSLAIVDFGLTNKQLTVFIADTSETCPLFSHQSFQQLMFSFQERLKLVTVLGAGLLCGTALAVIVPEGVHALYEDILEGEREMGLLWAMLLMWRAQKRSLVIFFSENSSHVCHRIYAKAYLLMSLTISTSVAVCELNASVHEYHLKFIYNNTWTRPFSEWQSFFLMPMQNFQIPTWQWLYF